MSLGGFDQQRFSAVHLIFIYHKVNRVASATLMTLNLISPGLNIFVREVSRREMDKKETK